MMIRARYLLILWVVFLMFPYILPASEIYTGVWKREGHYLNGMFKGSEPSTLVISSDAFNRVILAPPEQACGLSASLSVSGDQFYIEVVVSSCPSIIPIDTRLIYTYKIERSKLILTHTTPQGKVKEIFNRENQAGGAGGTAADACAHPYCGTWLRTATYVSGNLVHTEPSTAVITNKTYWAVAAACYNLLDIISVLENKVTLKMVQHNCPTPPGFMPPGHLVPATWKLVNNGEKLVIIDTNYGVAVTTDFKRLK